MIADMYGDRSKLMSAYNFARWFARRSPMLEEGRVNRAWGYIMSGKLVTKCEEYGTTISECYCYDSERGWICKHRIGLQIIAKAKELAAA